jgi:hypothetical protein
VNTSFQFLLRTASPYKDESLAGYILRLTEKNYYESPRWIWQLAGLSQYICNPNRLFPPQDNLDRLSQATGVKEDILWSMTFPPVNPQTGILSSPFSKVAVFNQVTLRYMIHTQTTKVCSQCLVESLYVRKLWDLSFVTACPVHRCLLIDQCVNCRKYLTWWRSKVAQCPCGFDWRELNVVPLPEAEVVFCKYVHQLCGLTVARKNNWQQDLESNSHIELNLENLIGVIVSLIEQDLKSRSSRDTYLKFRPNQERHLLITQAVSALATWFGDFSGFLGFLTSDSLTNARSLKFSPLGNYLRELNSNLLRKTTAFLLEHPRHMTQNSDFKHNSESAKKLTPRERRVRNRLERAHQLRQGIASLQMEIERVQASGEVAPPGCSVNLYQARGNNNFFWYYKLQAKQPIFPSTKNPGKFTKYKHLGASGTEAHLRAVLAVARREKIDMLERTLASLEQSLEIIRQEQEPK